MLMKSAPQEKYKVKIFKNELIKMTLYQVQESKDFSTYFSWGCNSRSYDGCKSEFNGWRTDPNDVIYHCDVCNFDYCEKCNDAYPNGHVHDLKKITFAELSKKNSAYTSWGCDARTYKGCKKKDQGGSDLYEILYHDPKEDFDLCEDCFKIFKIAK